MVSETETSSDASYRRPTTCPVNAVQPVKWQLHHRQQSFSHRMWSLYMEQQADQLQQMSDETSVDEMSMHSIAWQAMQALIIRQNSSFCQSGNQCNSHNTGVVCSVVLASVTNQAPAFCTTCILCNCWLLTPRAGLSRRHCRQMPRA